MPSAHVKVCVYLHTHTCNPNTAGGERERKLLATSLAPSSASDPAQRTRAKSGNTDTQCPPLISTHTHTPDGVGSYALVN